MVGQMGHSRRQNQVGRNERSRVAPRILEETGLKISDIKFVLVQDCIHSKEFYRDAHFVLLNYTCRCAEKNPRVKLNDEGREFRWLKLAEAKKLKLNRPTKILLAAVLKRNKVRAAKPENQKPKIQDRKTPCPKSPSLTSKFFTTSAFRRGARAAAEAARDRGHGIRFFIRRLERPHRADD